MKIKDLRYKEIIGIVLIILIIIGASIFLLSKDRKNGPISSEEGPIPTPLPYAEVNITERGFEPPTLKIKANSVVVWYNKSGTEATVNSGPHPEHSLHPELNLGVVDATKGATQTYFENKGTYQYHNHLKPEQEGVIIVE